jgi:hypothetical protein
MIEPLEHRRLLSTVGIVVSSIADSGAGTLRSAIQSADSDPSNSYDITFNASLAGETINLSTLADTTYGPAALDITNTITIDGTSAPGLTIARDESAGDMRLFNVAPSGSLTLNDLTLSGGIAQGGNGGNGGRGGGGGAAGLGGAIFNAGSINITGCTLTGNNATGGAGGSPGASDTWYSGSGGGGLDGNGVDGGTSTSGTNGSDGGGPNGGAGGNSSTAGSNGGFGGGGGGGAPDNINATTQVGGNGGFGGGGGARGLGGGTGGDGGFGGGGGFGDTAGTGGFGGGNMGGTSGGGGAGMGGAIFNYLGTVTLTNSTLTANSAVAGISGGGGAGAGSAYGGAIFNYNGTLSALNCTISANSATNGGRGIYNLGNGGTATATVNNTIIGQTDASVTDYIDNSINSGAASSSGVGNLIRSPGNFAGTVVSTADPQLDTLASNGGPTQTMLPADVSPALNAGNNAAASGLTTDQRGDSRIVNSHVDIGSVELAVAPSITSTNTGTFDVSQNDSFTITTGGYPITAIGLTGNLPAGLHFVDNGDGTATLSGTPDAGTGGSYTLTLTADNGVGTNAAQSFTLNVYEAPTISSSNVGHFVLGHAGSFTVTTVAYPAPVMGGTGTLPDGLTFHDNGNGTATISGTPINATPGDYDLTLTASNGMDPDASQPFTLELESQPMVAVSTSHGSSEIQVDSPNGTTLFTVTPFPGKKVGVHVAFADLNGDGVQDLIVGAAAGGAPIVKIYNGSTGLLMSDFEAFPSSFTGGVNVATGDVNGDGTPDIIAGAGPGGKPRVIVFDGKTHAVLDSFLAYSSSFKGGVSVAAGTVGGGSTADIVTGAGPGGQPRVNIFNGLTHSLIKTYLAYGAGFKGGVNVAVGDVNGDGTADVITAPGAGGKPRINVFSGDTTTLVADFLAFKANFSGAVNVASADVNFDGKADIVVGGGPAGPDQNVEIFSAKKLLENQKSLIDSFQADGTDFAKFGNLVAAS